MEMKSSEMDKILIVEDEVLIAEHIKDTLMELGFNQIYLAHTRVEAETFLKEESSLSLAILDIRLHGASDGIEIGKQIKEVYGIPFLFLTAQSDASTIEKAVGANPTGYLTKPFKKHDVQAAVLLALRATKQSHLEFNDGWEKVKLHYNEILYVLSDGNYIRIFTEQKQFLVRHSLAWFLEQVPPTLFQRSHRSTAVNLTKIKSLSSVEVLVAKEKLPVSRSNYKSLVKSWRATNP